LSVCAVPDRRHRNIPPKPRRKRVAGRASGRPLAVAAAPKTAVAKASAKPGAREARSAARRQAILAAALDEFSDRGFAATRLDDVAKRAGVAKGTIYLYFRDKESLFQDLVRDMLAPMVGIIEALGQADLPMKALSERIVDLFVREVYETRRKDVVRLMLLEGRRFPKLAEFYYREVLAHILRAVRGTLQRAAARGEISEAIVKFPQIIVAPGLIAIIWSGLFDAYEPIDVRAMMKAHLDLLFSPGRAS
jgi:AcrR family transcriptional regulator